MFEAMHMGQQLAALKDWLEDSAKGGTCKSVNDFLLVREAHHDRLIAEETAARDKAAQSVQSAAGSLAPIGSLAPST